MQLVKVVLIVIGTAIFIAGFRNADTKLKAEQAAAYAAAAEHLVQFGEGTVISILNNRVVVENDKGERQDAFIANALPAIGDRWRLKAEKRWAFLDTRIEEEK